MLRRVSHRGRSTGSRGLSALNLEPSTDASPPAGAAGIRLPFAPGRAVAERLAALGRTEDLQFSPDQSRLAICGFGENRILVLDLEVGRGPARSITAAACVELTCPGLRQPHGLAWIDDGTLVVANRKGGLLVLAVPATAAEGPRVAATPLLALAGDGGHGVTTPGSVAVARRGRDRFDLLVCNNFEHSVARLRLGRDGGPGGGGKFRVLASRRLLARDLAIPDGVAFSAKRRYIAVSNHDRHRVDIFRNRPGLSAASAPIASLALPGYPHGLRFADGDRLLLVADAGAPLVHIFRADAAAWRGVLRPRTSIRVMDDATFLRGRHNPEEGGPKGLDLLPDGSLFAVSSEESPLAFFDGAILDLPPGRPAPGRGLRARLRGLLS